MPDKNPATKLPTTRDIDDMVEHGLTSGGECSMLCHDLLNSIEQLDGPPPLTGLARQRVLARIRALRARMKELHCGPCLPE